MFQGRLPHSGLLVRLLEAKDIDGLAASLFSDPEVAKTLVHDVSNVERQRRCAEGWWKYGSIDSPDSNWSTLKIGMWAILVDSAGDGAPRLVGARGFGSDPGLPEGAIETYVAIVRPYWGRRISGDSSRLLTNYLFSQTEADGLYTNIWPLLNPRSEAIQRRLGFTHWGRTPVGASHGETRMAYIRDFELWRAERLARTDDNDILHEIAIKLGQLATEGIHGERGAVEMLEARLAPALRHDDAMAQTIRQGVADGFRNPGWKTYRLTHDDWSRQVLSD